MTREYQDPFGPPWRLNWLRMIWTWEASIFQFFWVEWFLAVAVCTAVIYVVYLNRKDVNRERLDVEFLSFVETVQFINNRFQSALGLMLGFYTSTIYGRWWNVRCAEGKCTGGVSDLSLKVSTLIRDDDTAGGEDLGQIVEDVEHDEEASDARSKESLPKVQDVRMQLIRWLNLAHAIRVGEVFEKKPNEFSSLEAIMDRGLCTESEYKFLKVHTRERFAIPLVWFQNLLMELSKKNLFGCNDMVIKMFVGQVCDLRGALGGLATPIHVPVPLSYRQLVNVTVRMYMAISLLASALTDIRREENLGGLTRGAFWSIFSFAFEYFLFVGWLTSADALGNPYRYWADSFDWESYVASTLLNTMDMSTGYDNNGSDSLSKVDESCDAVRQKIMQTSAMNSLRSKLHTRKSIIVGHYSH